ncbi:MAG TPA: hypothetical protein IAC31_09610 [Candidatus Faecousia intestinigallinarum]|nr:hypothetical protein [Candidatus Faecousia intestinigallinarum]
MGQYTKAQAVSIVVACAEQYRENLANKNFLFICQDKHKRISAIEFSFDASNFLHLTGLKVKKHKYNENDTDDAISAKDFYEKCLAHRLSVNDFEFARDGTTQLKLEVLPRLISRNLSATMIGDYNSRNPKLVTDKLAGSTAACMGFVPTGPSKRYVPNTVLKVDIRDYISNQVRVIAVYRKPMDAEQYDEATYFAKKIDWETVEYPEKYSYLLKPEPAQV